MVLRSSRHEHVYARAVYLAGIPVRDDLILELARLVDDDLLADKFESAYGREVKVLGLDIPERETNIRALEDPPAGLEELRGVLLREHTSGGCERACSVAGGPDDPLTLDHVVPRAARGATTRATHTRLEPMGSIPVEPFLSQTTDKHSRAAHKRSLG